MGNMRKSAVSLVETPIKYTHKRITPAQALTLSPIKRAICTTACRLLQQVVTQMANPHDSPTGAMHCRKDFWTPYPAPISVSKPQWIALTQISAHTRLEFALSNRTSLREKICNGKEAGKRLRIHTPRRTPFCGPLAAKARRFRYESSFVPG